MLDLGLEDLKELSKKDKMVMKYMENIDKVNKDPEFREYISYEEDQRKIYNTRMRKIREGEEKLKEGKEKLKEGENRLKKLEEEVKQEKNKIKETENRIKNEEKINIARNMLKDNVSIDVIIKYTNLSIDEINFLK